MAQPKIVVFISGNGSNLQALLDAAAAGALGGQIALVVSNRREAFGLERARRANVPTLYFPLKPVLEAGGTRADYDVKLADAVKEKVPDLALIVLAGWMHVLSPSFLDRFPERVINLHPALPGQFDGTHAIERAFTAYKEGAIKHTGIMVHHVIPAVDRGSVIMQREVPIMPDDTLEALEERVHAAEHALIVEATRHTLQQTGSS